MNKSFRYRLYPTKQQEVQIQKNFGYVRFVYNYYLAKRIVLYEKSKETFNYYACAKDLTQLKKELTWLKEADYTSLQSALKNLDKAYQKFFKEHKGYPKFKSKKTHKFSYTCKCVSDNIELIDNKKLKLPKLGIVNIRNNLTIKGTILSATISQVPCGKYYVSICCDIGDIKPFDKTGSVVGIDLGIKDFAITSDGLNIPNPKYLKQSLPKLVKLQKELSRKTKGSSNYNKQRIKVAKLQEHIANQRKDFLHKVSTQLIKEYDIICLEDLKVSNMLKNHKLSRNIADVSWSTFTYYHDYKSV
jgi:putative transposase